MSPKKILFLTGTRADYGKLKPLIARLKKNSSFEVHIFVTGMHMLSKYGSTSFEVESNFQENIYKYVNQNSNDSLDHVLSKTIVGLSDFCKELSPDLLIIHGDRVETLAGASVGSLNNILTCHIEGGEVSGTIDELIRHAVSKLSHLHFVSNIEAQNRLIQLGENTNTIFRIGSPDIDIMNSPDLPTIQESKDHYSITFNKFGIFLFHPVTTELNNLGAQIKIIVDALIASKKNYIVIYPNNDPGCEIILKELERLLTNPKFKIFPSMRFEYFLSILKGSEFIIGNSSAGIREAPHYGVPTINIGLRQHNRSKALSITNVKICAKKIKEVITKINKIEHNFSSQFGDGNSAKLFEDALLDDALWNTNKQKYFIDN